MGAELIGAALGTVKRQNTKLITLNMSGNMITDFGAIAIANVIFSPVFWIQSVTISSMVCFQKGLRTNRTLLVLNLAGNQIGDIGASKIAEVTLYFLKYSQPGGNI